MMSTLLKVDSISSGYAKLPVLANVSIRIEEGTIVSVLGANGAGKSTLLKTISGIVRPRAGEISFDGIRIDRMSPSRIPRLGIAHVPEGRGVFPELTVFENLRIGMHARSGKRSDPQGDLEVIYDYFPVLKDRSAWRAGLLSGGERQMLSIARALVAAPKVLMIDELSFGLAPQLVTRLFQFLQQLREERGVSVLLVEQNVGGALRVSDYVYILRTGEVALEGPASNFRENQEGLLASYLGGG